MSCGMVHPCQVDDFKGPVFRSLLFSSARMLGGSFGGEARQSQVIQVVGKHLTNDIQANTEGS